MMLIAAERKKAQVFNASFAGSDIVFIMSHEGSKGKERNNHQIAGSVDDNTLEYYVKPCTSLIVTPNTKLSQLSRFHCLNPELFHLPSFIFSNNFLFPAQGRLGTKSSSSVNL
jgi:hypothetical protein